MKTINPKSGNDRAFLRRIGGRLVETCFTCNHDFNGRCAQHDFQFVASTTHMVFTCNHHSPIVDGSMFAVTNGVSGGSLGVPRVKTTDLETASKAKQRKIYPGCYVDTGLFGEAVCIENAGTGNYIDIRYKATRCADQKTLWVESGVLASTCHYLRKADKISRAVLKLKGPCGEG